jgi:hypothetical protein
MNAYKRTNEAVVGVGLMIFHWDWAGKAEAESERPKAQNGNASVRQTGQKKTKKK